MALSAVSSPPFFSPFSPGGSSAAGQTRPTSGIGRRSSPPRASSGWRMAQFHSCSPSSSPNSAPPNTPNRLAQPRRTLPSPLTTTPTPVPTLPLPHYLSPPTPTHNPRLPHQILSTPHIRATATSRPIAPTPMSRQRPRLPSTGWPTPRSSPTVMQGLGSPMDKLLPSHPALSDQIHEGRALLREETDPFLPICSVVV